MEVKKEKKVFFSIFFTLIMYCKLFETQFQTVLLFKTCLWQFWTFWVSETCLWRNCLYHGIYRPLSETASPVLTHWGRVTHICVSKLTIIGSDNGLSPCRRIDYPASTVARTFGVCVCVCVCFSVHPAPCAARSKISESENTNTHTQQRCKRLCLHPMFAPRALTVTSKRRPGWQSSESII